MSLFFTNLISILTLFIIFIFITLCFFYFRKERSHLYFKHFSQSDMSNFIKLLNFNNKVINVIKNFLQWRIAKSLAKTSGLSPSKTTIRAIFDSATLTSMKSLGSLSMIGSFYKWIFSSLWLILLIIFYPVKLLTGGLSLIYKLLLLLLLLRFKLFILILF